MDPVAQRDLLILSAIEARRDVTQRALSQTVGIALGLTNLYVKRLVRKGYVKITTIPRNRIRYLLTPKGFAEKTRLTYQYMDYSLQLYRETRRALRAALEPLARNGHSRVILYGTGEAAELAYLTLQELGMELAAVIDGEASQRVFLGLPVGRLEDLVPRERLLVIVASFMPDKEILRKLAARGVAREAIVPLWRVGEAG